MRLPTRLAALTLSLLGFSGLVTLAADSPAPQAKPLSVLFLGDKGQDRPRPAQGLKPFEYERAVIPLYTPGARWGTLGEPIRKMQKPISPEESQKHLVLPAGFEAQLFVAEPQIFKPITMTWDHLGRLYVAETVDYPNEIQPKGKGRDGISIVEDSDGDGKAERVSLFADNLSIPTSLLYVNGGLVVAQAPGMLFLKDSDGDGKAEERKVLFTGFSTRDTHAGPSNLRYGLDNWIYAIIGYSGFSGSVGGERHNFRQGFFRFKPDGTTEDHELKNAVHFANVNGAERPGLEGGV